MVAVLASLRNAFALRNLSQEPGRFFVSLLLCALAFAGFIWLKNRPKSELPATWAQSMLGALAVHVAVIQRVVLVERRFTHLPHVLFRRQ